MQSLFFIHNGYRVISRFWASIHRKTERNCSDCIACVVVQEDNYFKKINKYTRKFLQKPLYCLFQKI